MSAVSNPLPLELQRTGTILAITRTSRVDPNLAEFLVQGMGFTATPTPTVTPTIMPTASFTQTPTQTATDLPTSTQTATLTNTPYPLVRGIAEAVINTYSCPGNRFKKGALQFGSAFHVLGWDQTIENGEIITWLLIEDELDLPQRWIQESRFLTLSEPGYREYIPRTVCRSAA